jgi:hypothetical protein
MSIIINQINELNGGYQPFLKCNYDFNLNNWYVEIYNNYKKSYLQVNDKVFNGIYILNYNKFIMNTESLAILLDLNFIDIEHMNLIKNIIFEFPETKYKKIITNFIKEEILNTFINFDKLLSGTKIVKDEE